MIKEIKCDIFKAPCDIIIHQCNCFCTMGAGIARAIRERFPEAYKVDCSTKKGDRDKMGAFTFARVSSAENPRLKTIVNLYGQFEFGLQKRHTDYEALIKGLERINTQLSESQTAKEIVIAVPFRMGCVNGGGDWRIVRAIIESIFADSPITVLICKYET